MQGWIKLHRQLLEWEWYDDLNTRVLFIHLLLRANHKDNTWHGIDIKCGEVLTGRKKLSKEVGLSEQQTRSSLIKLKSTNEITIKTTNKYSFIKINNWNDYQQDNQQTTTRATNKQPTNNQQITTNKNDKKVKNEKNDNIREIKNFWNEVKITSGKIKNETIKSNKPIMQQCKRITPDIEKLLVKHLKDYSCQEIIGAIKIYAKEICNRNSDSSYSEHRFSFLQFFKQGNAFLNFITGVDEN